LAYSCFVRDDLLRAQRECGGKLGRQRQASSSELVWQRLRAAITAARACNAVRTTLLYGCCAVSEQPAVCAWNRSAQERGDFAPNRSVIVCARCGARRDTWRFLEEVIVRVEKERKPWREFVDIEARAADPNSTYSIPSRNVKASSWIAVEPASRMW